MATSTPGRDHDFIHRFPRFLLLPSPEHRVSRTHSVGTHRARPSSSTANAPARLPALVADAPNPQGCGLRLRRLGRNGDCYHHDRLASRRGRAQPRASARKPSANVPQLCIRGRHGRLGVSHGSGRSQHVCIRAPRYASAQSRGPDTHRTDSRCGRIPRSRRNRGIAPR